MKYGKYKQKSSKPLVKSTIFTVLSEVVASFIKALHGLVFEMYDLDILVSVNV